MPSMKIQGKEYVIAKIFAGDEFAFVIPEYQRPYAWTTEQAEELLTDLLAMMGDDDTLEVEELPPYFLGSIVLIKEEGKAESIVVDGQQRLTTLTILLAALREVGNDDEITPFLYQARQRHVVGSEDRYRLITREEDRDFFKRYIQERNGFNSINSINTASLSDSQKNIVSNAKLFLTKLIELSDDRRNQLVGFILNRCVMIVVTSLDSDSAYRIFSILNDRGLDLSHTDILKAELIGKLSAEKQKQYAKRWVDLEDELGRSAFEDLFAHVRMIHRRLKMRESILKEFRQYVIASRSPQEVIDDILKPFGESFGDILTEGFESASRAEEVNALFGWLKRIDNVDWIPPAIAFLSANRNAPDKLVEYFTLLERLAASMFVRRVNITSRIDRYGSVLRSFADGQDISDASSPLQLSVQEKRDTLTALDGDIYNIPRVPLYILQRLDHALSDGDATYNYKTISIEHVLPQNPKDSSKWVADFPNASERESMTHKIGNLVLLNRRKNASASNLEFDQKKEKYFKKNRVSPFPLTTDVLREEQWTPSVVQDRQSKLIDTLAVVWNLK
jgi:hypothetical protein